MNASAPTSPTAPESAAADMARHRWRTLWLSDFHLGSRTCEVERLLDFLRRHDAEQIYLVGDIIDGWSLRRSWYWPQLHNDVVQKLLRKIRKGTRIIFIPGNHDEFARQYAGLDLGGLSIVKDALHTTADGRRLLVLHGDEYDNIVRCAPWLAALGSHGYDVMLSVSQALNYLRRKLGLGHWSLSAYLKHKVKNIMAFISQYEAALTEAARRRGADGIVCGHIHQAETRTLHGIAYYNTGDWVESCSAVAEHPDGRLEIIHWPPLPPAQVNPTLTIS